MLFSPEEVLPIAEASYAHVIRAARAENATDFEICRRGEGKTRVDELIDIS